MWELISNVKVDMNEEMLLKNCVIRLVQHKVTINCQFVEKKKVKSERVINKAQ